MRREIIEEFKRQGVWDECARKRLKARYTRRRRAKDMGFDDNAGACLAEEINAILDRLPER